ncbi:hypothetical protein MMC10_009597 [Thelotrema lepadinum]|nr:hypothetical protein [Thelotrema lepadinum]
MSMTRRLTIVAAQIIAADGGANRIYDLHQSSQLDSSIHPHFIIGDFDSIRQDVKEFYEQREGTAFVQSSDQYSTDFTKCLKFIANGRKKTEPEQQHQSPGASETLSTIAFGGLGGRADQAFAQIHQLYMAAQDLDLNAGELFLFTPESIVFVLEKGRNLIQTPLKSGVIGESVGIIPVSRPAVITTNGLEWDVQDWHTSFDTQMSTSNHITADEVLVVTSERVLFTLELAKKR